MKQKMQFFEVLRQTLQNLLLDAENAENPLEKLCDVGGMIEPKVLATAIKLSEIGKTRQLKVKMTEKFRKKRRNFEEFTEKTSFDRKTELSILGENRKKSEIFQLENPVFYEVEHPKKKEILHFLYPKVHYCPCKFFQIAVLDRQNEWICVHLTAIYLSIFSQKFPIIDCNFEIAAILRKILIRAVDEDDEEKKSDK